MNTSGIRNDYAAHGVDGFYTQFGAAYRNPHEPIIRKLLDIAAATWNLDPSHVLDLACGSGEVTLALQALFGSETQIDGIDPYTGVAYRERTGKDAEALTFEQIALGALEGREYSLLVCSFALHLVAPSRLPLLAYQLGKLTEFMLVITPNKKPQIEEVWGWRCLGEILVERVRVRHYQSRQSFFRQGSGNY